MTRVDTAALFEKIAYVDGTFVIDHAIGLIKELITKLRDKRLNRDFINSAIGRYTRYNIAEGDHLAEFGMNTSETILQSPQEMYRMPHNGCWIIDVNGTTYNH